MRISDWSSDVCSSDLDLGNVLQCEVDLRHRLEDQSLGEALIIIASEPGVQVPLVRQKDRAFDLEPIGCEPLEADRRIGAIGIGPEILPYARLRVEIGSDREAVEDLDLGALRTEERGVGKECVSTC